MKKKILAMAVTAGLVVAVGEAGAADRNLAEEAAFAARRAQYLQELRQAVAEVKESYAARAAGRPAVTQPRIQGVKLRGQRSAPAARSPALLTSPVAAPPPSAVAAKAIEDAQDRIAAKERELARQERRLKAREARLAATQLQAAPAPAPDAARLRAENDRLTEALIGLNDATGVDKW